MFVSQNSMYTNIIQKFSLAELNQKLERFLATIFTILCGVRIFKILYTMAFTINKNTQFAV